MTTFSAYSNKRTDIDKELKRNGIVLVTLHSAIQAQKRAEKAKSRLLYEMLEDAAERGVCLNREQELVRSKRSATDFIKYIDDCFEEILYGERDAPYKKIISIQVGDKICCIPLTSHSLYVLRASVEMLRRSLQ